MTHNTGHLKFEKESRISSNSTSWTGLYTLGYKEIGYFYIAFDAHTKRGIILQIIISEPFQGRGLGWSLVEKLEGFLKSKGARTFVANNVVDSAVGFWRMLGYERNEFGDMTKSSWAARGIH